MAIQRSIEAFLERNRIPFTTFAHPPAFTAQEQAAAAHVPGWNWAKSVVCIADGKPVFAVVPAPCVVDFERLQRLIGANDIRLASEDEIAGVCPDCEVGAAPPFGVLYGIPVYVDCRLVGEPEMVFEGGRRTSAICMHYGDFAEVAHPLVGNFGCMPPARGDTLPAESGLWL
jgi:Ala-tRNA(Pro) deacylase